jgi:hypothetical protein
VQVRKGQPRDQADERKPQKGEMDGLLVHVQGIWSISALKEVTNAGLWPSQYFEFC